MQKLLTVFLIYLSLSVVASNEPSQEALERWFENDDMALPETDKVNEGELQFLLQPPKKRTTSVTNNIKIDYESLKTGWVTIDQCYEQLDPINAVEVVYRYHNMRYLTIHSTSKITKAKVEGQSVQLTEVQKGAKLCVSLEAQIFYRQGNYHFVLRNGPFERRFLDGYYPLHVSLHVTYPANKLQFMGSKPIATRGFDVKQTQGTIEVDAWFEGKLMTELSFMPVDH